MKRKRGIFVQKLEELQPSHVWSACATRGQRAGWAVWHTWWPLASLLLSRTSHVRPDVVPVRFGSEPAVPVPRMGGTGGFEPVFYFYFLIKKNRLVQILLLLIPKTDNDKIINIQYIIHTGMRYFKVGLSKKESEECEKYCKNK